VREDSLNAERATGDSCSIRKIVDVGRQFSSRDGGLFTGAAFYVNFAEQTARLTLDDRALLAEWKPAYKRGYMMQAPLAVIGLILGIAAWWLTDRMAFLEGAVLMSQTGHGR
jgi:hypothetical protein